MHPDSPSRSMTLHDQDMFCVAGPGPAGDDLVAFLFALSQTSRLRHEARSKELSYGYGVWLQNTHSQTKPRICVWQKEKGTDSFD